MLILHFSKCSMDVVCPSLFTVLSIPPLIFFVPLLRAVPNKLYQRKSGGGGVGERDEPL